MRNSGLGQGCIKMFYPEAFLAVVLNQMPKIEDASYRFKIFFKL